VLREHRVRQVVIASDEDCDPTVASMVRSCDLAGVDVRVASRRARTWRAWPSPKARWKASGRCPWCGFAVQRCDLARGGSNAR
jgi:hypothetical protein